MKIRIKAALVWGSLLCGIVPGARGQEWTAKWIAAPWSTVRDGAEADGSRPMPIFRREFAVKGKVAHAELRIAGLGQYEARLDGKTVGDPALDEAWTDYRKSVMYDTYDVTSALRPGSHALGVMLGNGMYNVQHTKGRYTKFEGSFGAPRMIAELRVRYADGRTETIASDATWKVARGPIVFSSTYGGEDFDARKVQEGWDRAGFHDAEWDAVRVVDGPGGQLRAALAPRVRMSPVLTFVPIRPKVLGPNKAIFDFGTNAAAVVNVIVRGPAGAGLKLTPGELLSADGTVSQRSSGGPMWWSYTLRGPDGQGRAAGGESWQPQFSYYGFRYVQAEWEGGPPAGETVAGSVTLGESLVRSESAETGTFASSNEMLNRIHALIVNAMHNNEVSLFTDCPHREKLGWLEETHLVAAGMMFNNDLEGLYKATDANIADAQQADGMVPTIAPQYTKFGPKYPIYDDSPEWGSAAVLAPWAAYRFYGDKGELERAYPVMQGWVKYLAGRAVDGIVAYGLGDWYDIGPGGPGFEKDTTLGVTGTLMLYEDARAVERIAGIVGRGEDAAGYKTLAEKTAEAFNRRFWDAGHGWYDTGSQTANAMPLALGVVPEERRAGVLAHVIADIHAHQDHVTTGEVGYPYLLRALMAAGRDDVVMTMMMRKDPPSYGSILEAGATALTEAWDANPRNSQDHLMLGAGEEWFYRGLGGIDVDLAREKADERITIRPKVVSGVDWVRVGYGSKLGKIESDWKRDGGGVTLEVTVPVEATVVLPDGRATRVGAGRHRFAVKP